MICYLCQNLRPEAEHLRMTTWELKIQFLMRETSFSPTSIWRKTPRNLRGENSIFVATKHAQIRHMISLGLTQFQGFGYHV